MVRLVRRTRTAQVPSTALTCSSLTCSSVLLVPYGPLSFAYQMKVPHFATDTTPICLSPIRTSHRSLVRTPVYASLPQSTPVYASLYRIAHQSFPPSITWVVALHQRVLHIL